MAKKNKKTVKKDVVLYPAKNIFRRIEGGAQGRTCSCGTTAPEYLHIHANVPVQFRGRTLYRETFREFVCRGCFDEFVGKQKN